MAADPKATSPLNPGSWNRASSRSSSTRTASSNSTGWGSPACSTTLPAISTTAISKRIRSSSATSGCWSQARLSSACTSSSDAGTPGARRDSSAGTECLGDAAEGAEHPLQVGQLQDGEHLGAGRGDPQVAAGLAGGLQPGDDRAQAGGVHE